MEAVKDDPLFFAYYTVNTPYEQEAQTLALSLKALKLEHKLVPISDRGNWQLNTLAKAEVCHSQLEKELGRRLVYVDVDAFVIERPYLFWYLRCDFAALMWCPGELLSGTLYFRANKAALDLTQRWIEVCQKYPATLPDGRPAWDQRCLLWALAEKQRAGAIDFEELPPQYCWVVELTQLAHPETRPIIMHTRGGERWGKQMGKPVW